MWRWPFLWAFALTAVDVLNWRDSNPDAYQLILAILLTDIVLLVFNILPIYPLDGGQILRSLLWFPLGRARSLLIAAFLGFFGVAGLLRPRLSRRTPSGLASSPPTPE